MASRRAPRFATSLSVALVSESPRRWRLTAPLLYDTRILPPVLGRTHQGARPFCIVVPPGFVTDFASVPRIPVAWLVVGDTAIAPAVVHDWLYTVQTCTREQADKIFFEAMTAARCHSSWKRALMYSAVRWCGARAWDAHAGKDRQSALNLWGAWIQDAEKSV